ncbi:ABC transporter ATP-binding protein [Phaeobacter italicus]|jgi:branched-chain amino acid transport system ATP-binding protein|uniref:ABC transporter ATP-binding protein n=1 Tax=Phaeobacter italicus TaxID=481446 RepID=UPI002FDAF3CC
MAVSQQAIPDESSSSACALELNHLGKSFGALAAVGSVSLQIGAHERRAILGSNGAGKTTLFNLVTGDLTPSRGKILFFGKDITAMPVHQRMRIGMRRTYQISKLFWDLTVMDSLFLACRGVSKNRFAMLKAHHLDQDRMQAEEIAQKVHLHHRARERVKSLSYGEQRQLEIGFALAGNPRLILLDEPAAGLSPAERMNLVALLKDLPEELPFVIIEHDLDVALRVVDQVSLMHNGTVFKEGTPAEIEADPEVQRLYLGEDHG